MADLKRSAKKMPIWLAYVCAAIIAVGIAFTAWSKIKEARENRRGWRIGHDVWGIRYEEKVGDDVWNSLLIRATFRGHGFGEALIPPSATWDAHCPAWARGRREEIVARVRSERPNLPFIEEPNQSVQRTPENDSPPSADSEARSP